MIRTPLASDQGYIASTWAKSMLSGHAQQRHLRSRSGKQINSQISKVMDRADTKGLLVVRDDDPNYILSWMLYCDGGTRPIVFYLYTRRDERGKGHAAALLSRIGVSRSTPVTCTSQGPSSDGMRFAYPASAHVPLAELLG